MTDEAPNPFDPAALRLDQTFAEGIAVKKLITTVHVRKPSRQDFVRVHRDPDYRLSPAAIIELKDDREIYLVKPTVASELTQEITVVTLFTYVSRQGVVSLWPVRLPTPDGKQNPWHRSAADAAELAMRPLGARHLQHEPRRLRSVRGSGQHPRAGLAGAVLHRAHRDRVPRQAGRSAGPPARSEAAWRGIACAACRFAKSGPSTSSSGWRTARGLSPVCLVARELKGGRQVRLWRDELGPSPPYSLGADSLFVAYYASAEIGCHLALGWPKPARILDLFTEFRCATNGLPAPAGSGLIGALAYYGLDSMDASEKDAMRDLVLRGGGWSEQEREVILAYCERDVDALARLLPRMLDHIDLPRALLRGRYMAAAATMEHAGVPIDVALLRSAARALERHSGPAHRRDRSRLWRLRRPHLQGRSLCGLARQDGYPVAATRERQARSKRRRFPPGRTSAPVRVAAA